MSERERILEALVALANLQIVGLRGILAETLPYVRQAPPEAGLERRILRCLPSQREGA